MLAIMRIRAGLILLAIPVRLAAQAADPAPASPDPSTITAPDVTPSHDTRVREEGDKFYYFHNPGVTFAQAYQDLKACRGLMVMGGMVPINSFVPWDDGRTNAGSARPVQAVASPYGLVGATMATLILPGLERWHAGNRMQRCMSTRGYVRYAIPEATWDMLNEGDEQKLLLMQARLASGPKPQDDPVAP